MLSVSVSSSQAWSCTSDFSLSLKLSTSKGVLQWNSVSGKQMKVTTLLRHKRDNFFDINSDTLQHNIAKLDCINSILPIFNVWNPYGDAAKCCII